MCIKSAPAFSKSLISFPSLLKSADKIDGDIFIEGHKKIYIFIFELCQKKRRARNLALLV